MEGNENLNSGSIPPQNQQDIDPVGLKTETQYTKIFILVMGGLIVILILLAGLFFYNQTQTTTPATNSISPTPVQELIVTTTVENSKQNEDLELDEIENFTLPDLDTEMQDLEAELQNL